MPLLLHRAPRADLLAESLAGLLRAPLEDPFAKELVLVPARGVERWLSQRLSHRLGHGPGREDGVCAGVEFRSPASLIAEVTGTRDSDPWTPDALVWPLLTVVDAHAGEAWCRALSEHLGHGREGEEGELRKGRRYAVARRLARLFASYAAQRPMLLQDWEAGRDGDGAGAPLAPDLLWQAELWRRLVVEVGEPTPGQRQASVVVALRDDPAAAELPSRFSLFGHTRIPVTEVALLDALATHREVHLWLPHPSEAMWQALEGLSGAVPRRDDVSHEHVGHPLLASLGRDLRELERTLLTVAPTGPSSTAVEPTSGRSSTSVLSLLQDDIAGNALPDPATRILDRGDRSVQVHACHGAARQVEVLREVLLGLLADDATLEPRDILVMCPDIEAFAPLISAAFGMGDAVAGGHPGHQLRVRLADRALTQTNPLLAVTGQLLDLSGGRAEASRVLDLLATDPVRRRFGFGESDLETITGWVENAGVRWAFDQAHRKDYGLEGYVQNTWRFGLDRILTGVAVSDDAERWLDTTLPLDDVGSTTIDLAGRLAEFVERLRDVTDRLTGSHPVEHWLTALADGIALLTAVPRGDEWQSGQVQRELAALADDAARESGGALTLRLPDVRALMGERLSGRPTRANFRTGTLTVCTMVPMRSVPHRVVCLLGLDDGIFPRAGAVDGDDVLARNPLTGERDLRSEDRQLMLDAIMAAGEHLVITYTGANETTGHARPPAVPLGELLDAVDATVPDGKDHVVTHHPLQAFDRRNLEPGDFHPAGPFSFDGAALAGARAAERPRERPADLAGPPLPQAPVQDVDLAELTSFLKQPVKEFLRRRLVVALLDDGDEVADGLPVELDGLVQWGVGDRVLRDLLRGRTPDDALQKEWRRGVLPPGQLGWRLAKELRQDAVPVAEMAEATMGGITPGAIDVDVDLGGGRRLRGTVTDLYAERLVKVNFSRLGPKHMLDAWLPLVALSAFQPGRSWTAGAIGRGRRGQPTARIAFKNVDDANAVLADLVAIYDAGMREPLPLAVKAGHAWASQRRPGNDASARAAAEREWAPRSWDGENAEPAHVRVWGPRSSLATLLASPPRDDESYPGETTRFGALAMRLWRPIIDRGFSS